jgi:hypothetical protein
MILNGTGAYNTNSKETVNNELNKNLRQLSTNICCLTDTTSVKSDYEYVPVYEYVTGIYRIQYESIGAGRPFTVDITTPGQLTYNSIVNEPIPVYFYCTVADIFPINDNVITATYEDTLGRKINLSITPSVINLSNYPNTAYETKITHYYTSGIKVVMFGKVVIDPNGNLDPQSNFVNSNTKYQININSSATKVLNELTISGSANIPIEFPIASILEVRKDGSFLRYEDINHNPYTPTYCLSYRPIEFLQDFTSDSLEYRYDKTEHASIIGSVTYPPNTIHIFSITAISGNVQLTLGATTPIGIPNGTSITLPATTLISNQIQVNVTGGSGSSAYVTLIKP